MNIFYQSTLYVQTNTYVKIRKYETVVRCIVLNFASTDNVFFFLTTFFISFNESIEYISHNMRYDKPIF